MIKRKIAMMLILFSLAVPASQVKAATIQKNIHGTKKQVTVQKKSSNRKEHMLGIEGTITSLVKEKNSITVVIKGTSITEDGYNEIKLKINPGTNISDENNKTISLNDIKEGMTVKAYYPQGVTKSLPPQGVAKEIIITSKHNDIKLLTTEGNIVDINEIKNGIMATVQEKNTTNPFEGQIRLAINAETEIVNEVDGKKLTIDDIKDGIRIKAYYGPVVTMSIPAQSTAKKIIVVKEQKELYEVDCNIIDTFTIPNGIITYVQSQNESFLAFISEYSQIINEKDDKKLNINDINKNTKIKLYFNTRNSLINLRSYFPNICLAEKVVVKENVQLGLSSIEGKITEIIESKNNKMLLLENSNLNENSYKAIKLTINNDTEIINGLDGSKLSFEDIKKDTKILSFYGPMVTRSLPPISTAKKIIVLQNEKENLYCTEGKITEVFNKENGILTLIDGKKTDEIGFDNVKLNINNTTKILKQDGSELSYTDLKEGTKVKAYFGAKLTRSLPPIGNAQVIIVLED
jgi:hypothetical protein